MPLRITLENLLQQLETLEIRRQEGVDLYEQEFQLLKTLSEDLRRLPEYSCSCGEKEVNRRKNRYKDILPFDSSRVVLSEIPGVSGSDYINASYIKGASGSLAYIASQGPLPHTVEDFWRMVWECEVQVIIMASSEVEGGKHKCERYWVYENEEKSFGNLKISLVRIKQVCVDYIVRTMNLRCNHEDRTIIQFHYVTWPDHGIPDSVAPILNMVKLIRDCQASETLPILVHCSAGCGRTGTICAIDYVWGLLRTGKLNDGFNLFQLILDMRKQRIAMVQTKEQYILVHRAVKEMFEHHLKVIDSHPYENIDFSGLPLIDRNNSNPSTNGEIKNLHLDSKKKSSFTADQHLQKILSQLDSTDVPPIPEKKKTIALQKCSEPLPSPDDISVKHLISTWNSGKPCPVNTAENTEIQQAANYIIENNSSDTVQKPKVDHCDIGLHREEEASKIQNVEKANTPLENSAVSPDKAVVLRKPSIAKLRAIFEKGLPSPHEEAAEQVEGHDNENDENANCSLNEKKKTPGLKRHKSHFKKHLNSPQVASRYKDTALKVYAELRSSDDFESTESVSSSNESKTSSPTDKGKDAPETDFLYRIGSRRRSSQRNAASVWYDKETEISQIKNNQSENSPEKSTHPVKRSKSLKVNSITENAFGFFKLPSPLRHRKTTVAAYLAVEGEQACLEPKKDTSQNENTNSNIVGDKTMETSIVDKTGTSHPNVNVVNYDIEKANADGNLSNTYSHLPAKDNSKEKLKMKYFFGEKTCDSIPNFSNDSVKLVLVKNSLDTETNIPFTNSEKSDSKMEEKCSIEKSKSVEQIKMELFSGDKLSEDKNYKPVKELRNEKKHNYHAYSNTIPTSETVKKVNYSSLPSQNSNQLSTSKSAEQIEDKPPPLPVKVNSPRNSPRIQRPVRSSENTKGKNSKQPKYFEEKSIKKSVPSVSTETKDDNEVIPVYLTTMTSTNTNKSVTADSPCSSIDEEGYQQIIRSCQEYLLSSSYTNVFPEMEKNLLFIEKSLQKHPRGGFIDVLSSNESIASNSNLPNDKDENAVEKDSYLQEKMKNLIDKKKLEDTDTIQGTQEFIEENASRQTDNSEFFLPNAALDELLSNCEQYSSGNDQHSKDSVKVETKLQDSLYVKPLLVNFSNELEKNVSINPEPVKPSEEITVKEIFKDNKVGQASNSKTNYEHLWLSHSGSYLESSDASCIRNQTDDERTQNIVHRIRHNEVSMEKLPSSSKSLFRKEDEISNPKHEGELAHTYVNVQSLEIENPQNSIEIDQNYQQNDKNQISHSLIISSESNIEKTKSPVISRRKISENKEKEASWNLSSYKILKEILHKQNSFDESQSTEENQGVSNQFIENAANKKISETFDNSSAKAKISQEPPPKPARIHADNKNRKPHPLPRNILTARTDLDSSSSQLSSFIITTDNDLHNEGISRRKVNEIQGYTSRNNVRNEDMGVSSQGNQDLKVNADNDLGFRKENDYEDIHLPINIPQQERLIGASRNNKCLKGNFRNVSVGSSDGEHLPSLKPVSSQAEPLFSNSNQYPSSSSYNSPSDHVYESLDPVVELNLNPLNPQVKEDSMLKASTKSFPERFHFLTTDKLDSSGANKNKSYDCHQSEEFQQSSPELINDIKNFESSMYSEVSKGKINNLHSKGSPTQDQMSSSSCSKDDMELYPIAPPRKRQSSSLPASEVSNDQNWKSRTFSGRSSNCLQDVANSVCQWGEEWDSDDDCQPPVPAKTKEAYMLPSQQDSLGSSHEASESKNKSFSKFNIFSKLGLKTDNKNSDGVNSAAFPNRLPRRPQGPRTPPASWNVSVCTGT